MRKRLFFVFNPRAGKGLIKSKLMDIVDLFNKAGYEVILRATQGEKDAREQVMHYADQVDAIVCSGGDGTLDEVVSGLAACKSRVPIGYIPAGSTNDFANSLSISKNMLKAAQAVVDGQICQCDIGRMNGDTFAYIAAFGLFTDVAYATDQDVKNILGHVAYMLEGMKRLFDVKSCFMTVTTEEGRIYEGDFIFGMVTNSRSVGGFKNITGKNVDMADGLFEVTLIRRPKNPLELQEIMTSILLAEDRTGMIDIFKARELTIRSTERVAWTLDGEYGGEHQEVHIQNLHRAMNIFVNQPETGLREKPAAIRKDEKDE